MDVSGFARVSALPAKCLPFFLKGCLGGRKRRLYGYTFFLHLSRYILFVWSKQCVHALYPLFVCPKMLLRAGQSLMVTKSNARRSNGSRLCSSHTRTPGLAQNCKSFSTNGLRYTSMSLLGCIYLIAGFCFVPKQRYPRGPVRSSYSDIQDQEVLDSLSDRPWKEKKGWNANGPLSIL